MYKAVLEAGQIQIEPELLIEFESDGRLLLIGTQQQILTALPSLQPLHVYCLVLDGGEVAESDRITVVRQQLVELSGWLGAFNAQFSQDQLTIDLVLDLAAQSQMTMAVLPLGYFAPQDEAALAEVLQQLPDMIGIFDKPKFFNYKASICAHSRRGVSGCSQCIDACPAVAIESTGTDVVVVNPNLCQGCGSCTVVCPSGAMTYALPTLDVSINRLRKMMQTYFELEKVAPQILIHDESNGQALLEEGFDALPDTVIPFSVEEIGALGLPFWMVALAYGASQVTVCDALTHLDHNWQELQQQIQLANQLLAGMGYADNRVSFVKVESVTDIMQLEQLIPATNIESAQFAGIDDKRRMLTMAISHLHQQAQKQPDVMMLTGLPFGEIDVNKEKCTLCMSCVAVCPAGAVLDGVDKPQLNFIEDLCVQCGLCETACPEDAIDLVPRYLFDREQARKKRLLHEEPIFHCISCNKPFATQKMIDTIMAKLTDHPMFQGEAKRRLMMCEDCRVRAMFTDKKGLM